MDWVTGLVNARQAAIGLPLASPDRLAVGINSGPFKALPLEWKLKLEAQGTVTITPVQGFEPRRR